MISFHHLKPLPAKVHLHDATIILIMTLLIMTLLIMTLLNLRNLRNLLNFRNLRVFVIS